MIDDVKDDAKERMEKSIVALEHTLTKIRTGRAHPSLVENIKVSYYGADTPLNQVASVTVSDSRTLAVTPWEKPLVQAIEKAILTSDLGLNPATSGTVIRIPLPPLTEERRKDLIKVVRQEGESTKVAIRNIRRDANSTMKEFLKEKEITEDEERQGQDNIQKLTNQKIQDVDAVLAEKEKDLMEI